MPPRGAPAPKQPKAMSFVRPGGKVFPKIPRAVGAIAAAARPWKPLITSKPISFGMKGGMMEVIVKKTEPQTKMRRRPYTSANLPQSSCRQHQLLSGPLRKGCTVDSSYSTYQKAAESEVVCRYNPLLSASGDIKSFSNSWQDDDRSLNGHGLNGYSQQIVS